MFIFKKHFDYFDKRWRGAVNLNELLIFRNNEKVLIRYNTMHSFWCFFVWKDFKCTQFIAMLLKMKSAEKFLENSFFNVWITFEYLGGAKIWPSKIIC